MGATDQKRPMTDEHRRPHADTVIIRSLRTCDEMHQLPRPPFSTRHLLAIVVGVLVLLSSTSLAGAETPGQLRQKRKQVQADKAAAAASVDIAAGNADEVRAALDAMQRDVDAQLAAVEAAQRDVAQARAENAAARARIIELRARQQTATERMQAQAVEAYVSFQGPSSRLSLLNDNPWQRARETSLVEFATGNNLDALDQLRRIGADLEAENRRAQQAEAEAEQKTSDLKVLLVELSDARDRQAHALDEANARLDDKLAELASLKRVDAKLAADIRSEEQKIADAIAARRRRYAGPYKIPDNLDVKLTKVWGITVNVVIAKQFRGLLSAMSAKGFVLGGGGYRNPQSQINLRRKNCGTSQYAIWQKPASRCRPPTAPPGRSAHERGLAIDLTYNGRALRSRSSKVYKTLTKIAPKFGFKNLPSEPWHWSVTGT